MKNLILTCIQCDTEFEFSEAEQQRHHKMGFANPLRCPQCRRNKMDINDFANPLRSPKHRDKKKHYRSKYG